MVPAGEVPIVCEPAAVKGAPRTDYDAKFSLPFTLAAALREGRVGVSTFEAERRGDAALLALAARVRHTEDPDSPFPRSFPGRVRVRLVDGRMVEAHEPENRGGPGQPPTESEVVEKFRDNAGRALPGFQVREIEKAALDLEGLDDVGALMTLCRRG